MDLHEFTYNDHKLQFHTKPGVFAQYGLDYGSQLLLDTILPILQAQNTADSSIQILDLGCGCGFIGQSIAKVFPQSEVYQVDTDIRAIRLTRQNAKHNKISNINTQLSDGTKDLPKDLKFDYILSNPPTHQGKEVLLQFIDDTYFQLKNTGTAFFVVNRLTSMLNKLETKFTHVEKLTKKQGYIVLEAHNLNI